MKIINCDYKDYVLKMEKLDFCIIDPPWKYDNDDRTLKAEQVIYGLWNDNNAGLDFLFKHIKCNYLFLWTPNSMLDMILRRTYYGFDYKTMVTWIKRSLSGEVSFGMGYTFRNCTEHLLVFQKRGMKSLRIQRRNLIVDKIRKRTQKPKKFEVELVKILNEREMKGCYLFSGLETNCFNGLNIDLVDSALKTETKIL